MPTASLTIDKRAFEDALDAWTWAAGREGVAGNLDAAKDVQGLARDELARFSHGPGTKTPSPLFGPPGDINGVLSASIDARHDGEDALVGPTSSAASNRGPYGRFLELGGRHRAHRKFMKWVEDGKKFRARRLEKWPRPYLRPAVEDAFESGMLLQTYYVHWLRAQQEVTH